MINLRWPSKKQIVVPDEIGGDAAMADPILDILKRYPSHGWKFSFSESRVMSQWPLRASGTCINPKGAMVTFEIYAPPIDSEFESGFVKVTVDTFCLYRQEWDGYRWGSSARVRDQVLRSPYWKWIESRYEANISLITNNRWNELAQDSTKCSILYGNAISKL